MNQSVTYQVNLEAKGSEIVGNITRQVESLGSSVQNTTKRFGDCYKALMSFSLVSEGLNSLKQSLDELIAPGANLNANMLELSAITGVTGEGLKAIEKAARDTSKTFGTDASANVESYKMMLSQLSPELAKNSEAMKMMGENVNILSKQMGGDTVAATDVLNTSLNQFGVSMDDPIAAAKIMADMMNVMSAAAQEGSAELPQIKQALEQVGMVAKTTGLSFAETNAYIQLLDQAGKKGSEGGVALRNVLTTLSEGRFTSKHAADGLKQAGISVEYLANTSIPLHERLRTLRKIQGDTALMTKVFGKENMAAAIAMINSADEAEKMTKKIVGTNSATEQAKVIMGGYNEKMSRFRVKIEDFKISIFNATQAYIPYVQNTFTAINTAGRLANSFASIRSIVMAVIPKLLTKTAVTSADTLANTANATSMGIGSTMSKLFSNSLNTLKLGFLQATFGATGFQVALDALGIGLIILAITALIAALSYLYHHCRKFREILGYIAGAGKAVFHNLGVYAGRLWSLVIKPVAEFILNVFKSNFLAIWEVVKMVWNGISTAISFTWNHVMKPIALFILNIYKMVFMKIWSVVKWVFGMIKDFALSVWNFIKNIFSTLFSWINSAIINPIKNVFSELWNWISGLLDRIFGKLSGVLQPIRDLWNSIFSSEGTVNIHQSGMKGAQKEGEAYDQERGGKNSEGSKGSGKPQEVKVINPTIDKPIFDVSKGSHTPPSLGGVAADGAKKKKKERKGHGSGGSEGESGNKVRNLTVGKMVENLNIYTQRGGVNESKEQLIQAIKEIFATAVTDFAGMDKNATAS